jgi:tetratricopeptide (TPR) repeat protein
MSKQQIAKCCTLLQRYAEAAKHLEDCQKIYKSKGINDERLHAYTHYFLGLNFHWQEKLTEARCHYEQDLKISYGQRWEIIYMQGSESSERPKDPVHVGEPLTNLAEVLYAQGDRNKARTLLHHARKYAEMFQNKELLEYQKVIQQKIDGRVDTSEGDGHETKESSS